MNDLQLFQGDKLESLTKAAGMLAKSTMIPRAYQGKAQDVFAVIVSGAELGLSPMQSLRSFHVIQGNACMSAQTMLALVRSKMKNCAIKIELDEENLVAKCSVMRDKDQDFIDYVSTWDMEKAGTMGLAGRDQYKKQPMTMLKWRAVAEACRSVFSDVLYGIYASEEFMDIGGNVVEDFSIQPEEYDQLPANETEVGSPDYRIMNAKYRGKQLKEIELEELLDYRDILSKRIDDNGGKTWERDVYMSITCYAENLDKIEDCEL